MANRKYKSPNAFPPNVRHLVAPSPRALHVRSRRFDHNSLAPSNFAACAKSHCTVRATVTIALLDSTIQWGSDESFTEKFQPNFSTLQKNLCYYAGLIRF
jgi:hypothetical protein